MHLLFLLKRHRKNQPLKRLLEILNKNRKGGKPMSRFGDLLRAAEGKAAPAPAPAPKKVEAKAPAPKPAAKAAAPKPVVKSEED